jgi:hypothetical protein
MASIHRVNARVRNTDPSSRWLLRCTRPTSLSTF